MDSGLITQELNLKAMTALGTLVSDEKRGLITPAQAATGCRAIFDAVGGLVSTECFDLISAAVLEYKGKPAFDVHLIKKGDHIEGVIRVVHSSAILRIHNALPFRAPGYTDDVEIASIARQDAANLLTNIRTQGAW